MEALIFVVSLVSLAALALRFGADSRPALRSHEHFLATTGMVWDSAFRPVSSASSSQATEETDGPTVRSVVWSPTTRPGNPSPPCPTLEALDRARDPGQTPFATDPDANLLEQRARHLIEQHWSDLVWLTGLIDQVRFDLVCDALERDRRGLQRTGQPVEMVVVTAQPAPVTLGSTEE